MIQAAVSCRAPNAYNYTPPAFNIIIFLAGKFGLYKNCARPLPETFVHYGYCTCALFGPLVVGIPWTFPVVRTV